MTNDTSDPYPTDDELAALEHLAKGQNHLATVSAIIALWYYPDRAQWNGQVLELSTGGWSGNEDVIAVIQNTWFWWQCWDTSKRGGYYKFVIPLRCLDGVKK